MRILVPCLFCLLIMATVSTVALSVYDSVKPDRSECLNHFSGVSQLASEKTSIPQHDYLKRNRLSHLKTSSTGSVGPAMFVTNYLVKCKIQDRNKLELPVPIQASIQLQFLSERLLL